MAKYSYEITIPNQGTFVIDSDRELSDAEAYQAVIGQAQPTAGQEFARGAGLAARGAAPAVAGAGAGFLAGGPPGALAGSLALPLAEVATQGLNVVLPEQYQIPSPSVAVENFLTGLGFPVPANRRERVIQAAGGGLGGAATQLATLPSIARTATTETGRGLAAAMAEQQGRQLAAAAPAAASAQVAGEEFGPVAGQLAGMATAAPFSVGAKPRQVEKIPTVQELKQTASKLYKIADESGVVFKSNPFSSFVSQTAAELRKGGVNPKLTPKADAALDILVQAKGKPATLSELENLRRIALIAATSGDDADRTFGSRIIEKIDSFVETAPDSAFAVKDKNAIEALKDARNLWKQSKKSQIIETIFDVAELRAQTNFTQSGMEQALRSRLTNLAANEKLMRQFNKTEREAIRQAAKGGSLQNMFRYLGKLAPTSVIPAVGGAYLGTQAFGNEGLLAAGIPAAVGATSREAATRIGLQNFRQLENMLKLGRQPRTPVSGVSSIITRGLISPYQQPLDVTAEDLRFMTGQ